MNKLGFGLCLALAAMIAAPVVGCMGAPFEVGGGGAGTSSSSSSSTSTSSSSSSTSTSSSGGTCTGTQVDCNGTCADLSSDKLNCGKCANKCKGVHECVSGQCACVSPYTDCNGTCANLQNDLAHCSACNIACPSGGICNAGNCGCSTAFPDFCQTANVCVNFKTDPLNCGMCGKSCNGTQCVNGNCTTSCSGGSLMTCGNKCVDTSKDADHCGSCTKVCPAGSVCNAGNCECANNFCGGSPETCGAPSNPAACGGCGACGHLQSCFDSSCGCRPELLDCSGNCVDGQTDHENCGQCGTACEATEVCIDGQCKPGPCGSNSAIACNPPAPAAPYCLTAAEGLSDPLNCGGCGKVCAPDAWCLAGACHQYFFVPSCGGGSVPSECGSAHKCCPNYMWNGQSLGLCWTGDVCPPALP